MAGSVIQASGMVLFEEALMAGTLVMDILSAASICTILVVNLEPHVRSHPDLGVQVGVEMALSCLVDLFQPNRQTKWSC